MKEYKCVNIPAVHEGSVINLMIPVQEPTEKEKEEFYGTLARIILEDKKTTRRVSRENESTSK